jgi:hypothetical protein
VVRAFPAMPDHLLNGFLVTLGGAAEKLIGADGDI